MTEHPSSPDQLMARTLGVCWHSPTSDRWPCGMTEPVPAPVPFGWPENSVIWCTSCEIHLALVSQPLCPPCLDERVRGLK